MHALGCLLMILLGGFLAVLSLGFSLLDGILRLFGLGSSRTRLHEEKPEPAKPEPRKVFSDDEGEYVDFEEV